MAFTTQTRLEAKITAARLLRYGDRDRDNTLDATTLLQAVASADAKIIASLRPRYGAQVDDWTSATTDPDIDLLLDVADSLGLYYFAVGSGNAVNEPITLMYNDAIETLRMLRDYEINLPGVLDTGTYDVYTDETDSDFDED